MMRRMIIMIMMMMKIQMSLCHCVNNAALSPALICHPPITANSCGSLHLLVFLFLFSFCHLCFIHALSLYLSFSYLHLLCISPSLSFPSLEAKVKDNIYRKPPIYKQHGTVCSPPLSPPQHVVSHVACRHGAWWPLNHLPLSMFPPQANRVAYVSSLSNGFFSMVCLKGQMDISDKRRPPSVLTFIKKDIRLEKGFHGRT